mmetsp:Transcript_19602/g.78103  ORF Transcript_19602/g.78103 Transcript_19602/m.78103 type:complete len:1801 (-) Transcript_19602:622-6024(-)
MPSEEVGEWRGRASLSFDRLRKDVSGALSAKGLYADDLFQADVVRNVHSHLPYLQKPFASLSTNQIAQAPPSALDNAGKEEVTLSVIGDDGVYSDVTVNLAPDFIAAAKGLSDELCLDAMDTAGLLYSARSRALKRPDKDVAAACRDLFRSERKDQLLTLQELLRTPLASANVEGKHPVLVALVRERDVLVISNVMTNLMGAITDGLQAGFERSKSNPKGLLEGELVLLAECVFLFAYTVQCTSEEALSIRRAADLVAEKLSKMSVEDPGQLSRPSHPRTRKQELTVASHLLFLSWSCALDRSRYSDLYNPRTSTTGLNELLRDRDFLEKSKTEQSPALAPHELVGCLFRLASEVPDEEENAVSIPLRVCMGGRKALKYLSEDLPDWLSSGSAILSSDCDLYADAYEDFTIDVAEAPTLCSVLIDFTQESTSAAASYTLSGGHGGSVMETSIPEGSNLVAALARCFKAAVSLTKVKLSSTRSVYGGLRYLSGAHGSGGVMQRIGDAIIDLGDTAMRDPDAPGGVGKVFTEALVEFLNFLESCSCVSVPYAATVARYLAEAGHPMASMDRLHAAVSYYTQALRETENAELNPAESKILGGLIAVVGSCSATLYQHGDFLSLVGQDFPIRLANLAVLETTSDLKSEAVRALEKLHDAPGILAFLESATMDRCSGLAKELNAVEAANGKYSVTLATMELTLSVLEDMDAFSEVFSGRMSVATELPSEVDAMVQHIIDNVLSHWGRRQYRTESERWRVARAAVDVLFAARKSNRMIGKLLATAPGSGGPCSALKAVAAIAGIRENPELEGFPSGAEALAKAAASGDGQCERLMEKASSRSCVLLHHLLDIPSAELRRASVAAAGAGELLLSESKSVVDAASLMGSGAAVSAPAAAYIAKTVAAAPALSSRITSSPIARDLRASLGISMETEEEEELGEEDEEPYTKTPLFNSILKLVVACLSNPKSIDSGFFLLGVNRNSNEVVGEYGILEGICERIRSATRLDDERVATAASFLAYLAGNSAAKTSFVTLEYLRNSDLGSCASQALTRIYVEVQVERVERMRFSELTRCLSACMRVTALESHKFAAGSLQQDDVPDGGSLLLGLLRIIARFAREENLQNLTVSTFSSWRQLFWTCAPRFQKEGRLNTLTLYEIAAEVLEGLGGSSDTDMEKLVSAEGCEIAASTALLSVSLLREPPSESESVDLTQAASVLEKVVHAIAGNLGPRADGASARTALYAVLVHTEQLIEKIGGIDVTVNNAGLQYLESNRSSREVIDTIYARALGDARIGRRQWSGAEGVIAVASGDALSGSAAARSAAVNAIACILRMDCHGAKAAGGAMSSLNALSAQNRLRKLSSLALADSDTVIRIGQLFSQSSPLRANENSEKAASLFVAESVLVLLHQVANVPGGSRTLVDAGVVENVALLASALSSAPNFGEVGVSRSRFEFEVEPSGYVAEHLDDFQNISEIRASLAGSIAGLAAASLRRSGGSSRPDSGLASPAIGVVESGQVVFAELIRDLRDASCGQLAAASSVGLLLSRLPRELADIGGASMLVHLSSRFLWSLFRSKRERVWSGGTPKSTLEARRAQISHPEGGTLFERDLGLARMTCARVMLSAMQGSSKLLTFFNANVASSRDAHAATNKASLWDVVEVTRIVVLEMQRSTEEEMRITANLPGVARRSPSLKAFCVEEFGLKGSSLDAKVLETCMLKVAEQSRLYADRLCGTVVESLMYILREYSRAARELQRGNGKKTNLSEADADAILVEGRANLLSLCRDIDSIDTKRDVSFMRQLSRQIRTYITEK